MPENNPLVGIIMGSTSDWETMQPAANILKDFGVAHECRVVSAHRTPDLMNEYAKTAEARGLQVIIAGAGGAAHLPGMVASQTVLPVLGVPVKSRALNGLEALQFFFQLVGATLGNGISGHVSILQKQTADRSQSAVSGELCPNRALGAVRWSGRQFGHCIDPSKPSTLLPPPRSPRCQRQQL